MMTAKRFFKKLQDFASGRKSQSEMVKILRPWMANSAGSKRDKIDLAIIDQELFLDKLLDLIDLVKLNPQHGGPNSFNVFDIYVQHQEVTRLGDLFDIHCSDKGSHHKYENLYARIISTLPKNSTIFEIGLGTPNTKILSNMGPGAKPGASLRALSEYRLDAKIYGADIDSAILFNAKNIETFYLDQNSDESFKKLGIRIPEKISLVIDDGLHSPLANINTLLYCLPRLSTIGWIVIEDIGRDSLVIWKLIQGIMESNFLCQLVETSTGNLFVICNDPDGVKQFLSQG